MLRNGTPGIGFGARPGGFSLANWRFAMDCVTRSVRGSILGLAMTLQDVTPGPRSQEFDQWVELAHQLWDRFNEGEYHVTPRWLDSEIELQDLPGLPDREWHRGLEGVGRWVGKLLEVGSHPNIEILDFLPVDHERVLFEAVFRAEFGKRSELNMPVEVRVYPLVTMRNGKFRRMALFADRKEALEAAGLSE